MVQQDSAKVARWRKLILWLCTVGAIAACVNLVDVIGIGRSFPWLGTQERWIGRWGAYFGEPNAWIVRMGHAKAACSASSEQLGTPPPKSPSSQRTYHLNVVSVDPYGPAYRAGLKPCDMIAVGGGDKTNERFWKLYRAANDRVVRLTVWRAAPNQGAAPIAPFSTQLTTGPPLSLYGFVLVDCGSLLLLFLAVYYLRRETGTSQHLMFATLLALLALGVVCDPASFGFPWWPPYVVLGILSLALPASVAVWAHFASHFGGPISETRLTLERVAYALAALSVGLAALEWIAIGTLWFNPVPLTFGVYAPLPMVAAIGVALTCNTFAIVSARGKERLEALVLTIPIATIYLFTQVNSITARLSPSYQASHVLLLAENAVILIAPLALIYITSMPLCSSVFRRSVTPLVAVAAWVEKQPNSFITWLVILGAVALLYVSTGDLKDNAIVISDISVPKDFSDGGFSSSVESVRLRDALNDYVKTSQSALQPDQLFLSSDEPALVIPTLGLRIDYIADVVAKFFHSPRPHVNGEITETANAIGVRLRNNDTIIYDDSSTPEPLHTKSPLLADQLLNAAPQRIFSQVQPYVVAAHAYSVVTDEPVPQFKEAVDDAKSILNSGLEETDPSVIFSHLLLGDIYAQQQKPEEEVVHEIDVAKPYGDGKFLRLARGSFFMYDYRRLIAEHLVAPDDCSSIRKDGRMVKVDLHDLNVDLQDFLTAKPYCRLQVDQEQALYAFSSALNADPEFGQAWEELGLFNLCLDAHGDRNSSRAPYDLMASDDLATATKVEPDDAEFWKHLAEYDTIAKKYAAAVLAYEKMISNEKHANVAQQLRELQQHVQDATESDWIVGELAREARVNGHADPLAADSSAACKSIHVIQSRARRPR